MCTRIEFVDPDTPGGIPATTTTMSPSVPCPEPFSTTSTWLIMSSVCSTCGTVKVWIPQLRASWLRTSGTGVKASSGIAERSRDIRRAESPDWVKQVRYFTPRVSPICAAALVITPPRVCGVARSLAIRSRPCSSVFSMIRAMVRTHSIGYSPTLVSPESITASAPSSTALAQSEASARVGLGALIIDSSTWVATITGLALRRHISVARFCTIGTCSRGSSTPRSPRATMMPSKASTISARFSTACGFSIFAITGTWMPSSAMIAATSA